MLKDTQKRGFLTIAAISSNRISINEDKVRDLKKGQFKFFKYQENETKLLLTAFHDVKLVFFISSGSENEVITRKLSSRKKKIDIKFSKNTQDLMKNNLEAEKKLEEEEKLTDKPEAGQIEYEDDYLEREERLSQTNIENEYVFFKEADDIEEEITHKKEDSILRYSWPEDASEHEIVFEKEKMEIEKPKNEIDQKVNISR